MDPITYIPWFAWIPIAGIVVWGIVAIIGAARSGGKTQELEQALTANAETNARLVERLDAIDVRLSSVEKTLNDIP